MKHKKGSLTKSAKAGYIKRVRRGFLGFTIQWIDMDPGADVSKIYGAKVDHVNPTQRLICKQMWAASTDMILLWEYTWEVYFRVTFTDVGPDRGAGYTDYPIRLTCALRGKKSDAMCGAIAEAYANAINANNSYKDGHKKKGTYSHCEFRATIVGV
jgi:hypothetical protein